jgi:hypothetical protein
MHNRRYAEWPIVGVYARSGRIVASDLENPDDLIQGSQVHVKSEELDCSTLVMEPRR